MSNESNVAGTVKFFNHAKGFGFISREDGGDDVFIHVSEVAKSPIGEIAEGDKVLFDTKASERKPNKGPVACNVRAR